MSDEIKKTDNEKEELSEGVIAAAQAAPEEGSLIDDLLEWCEAFIMAIFVVILIFIFFLRVVEVSGDSMNDTLFNADRILISHLNYTPKSGDIIVCNSDGLDKVIVKRCIGVAGDVVKVDYSTGKVTVNGEEMDQSFIREPMIDSGNFDKTYKTGDTEYTYTVPEGTVFAMGDNRNHSTDCRWTSVGFISTDDILGKAVFRILPFGSFGKIE